MRRNIREEIKQLQSIQPPRGTYLTFSHKTIELVLCLDREDYFEKLVEQELSLLSRFYEGKWHDREMFINNAQYFLDNNGWGGQR
jgi:hypothetical protein